MESSAPWTLHKEGDTERLNTVLASLARSVTRITVLASPFMPSKTQEVWEALGQSGSVHGATWDFLLRPELANASVTKPPPLFPKLDSRAVGK